MRSFPIIPFAIFLVSAAAAVNFSCTDSTEGEAPGVTVTLPDSGMDRGDGKVGEVIVKKTITIEKPATGSATPSEKVDTRYEPRFFDPVLEQIEENGKKRRKSESDETAKIQERQGLDKEKRKKEDLSLKSSLPSDEIPSSIEQFTVLPHLPPVAQYNTGTCWSFAATSLMESEVIRKTKREIKLSEMYTVYWEYVDKAARFVEERGGSLFAEGSEVSAIQRVWRVHGAVPLAAYRGVTAEDGLHDHERLVSDMKGILDYAQNAELWNSGIVERMLRVVLDRDLGPVPSEFEFEGRKYTPKDFLSEVLQLNMDDYVSFMSTLKQPFYTLGELEVEDNWWKETDYHNLPMEDFYDAIKTSLEAGYTVTIGGDVSEPGKDGDNDVLFIPPYDIPEQYIDQLAREYRIYNNSTTDDHGVHVVGYANLVGHDWFLIKDSGRSSRWGKHKGYYFMRGDYLKLKMLAFTVHKDAVTELLAKF